MRKLLALSLLMLLAFSTGALAQAPMGLCTFRSSNPSNGCIPVTASAPLPVSGSISITFPTIGAAVPSTGLYNGINVAGTLRGWTGVNPSGSIYAGQVDLASVAGATVATGHGTASGAIRVELPTDGTGVVTAAQATASSLNATVVGTGTFATQAAPTASTTGGASMFHLIAANSNNSTSVKGSAGTVYSVQLGGLGSAPAYLKFYNTSGAPTCASDTVVKTLIIPAASTAANGGGSNVSIPVGLAFSSGIGICVVTGIADNDNTSVAASTFIINIDYK